MSLELEARPYTPRQLLSAYWSSEFKVSAYFLLFATIIIANNKKYADTLNSDDQ